MLDKRNKKIAGVCAGLARYFGVDVNLVRLVWLVITICTGGLGVVAYLGAWLILPSDHGTDPSTAIAQHPQTAT